MKNLLYSLLILPVFSSAQFTQNFDGSANIPTGWAALNGGDTNTWQIINFTGASGIAANSGTNAVGIKYGSTAHDDYLVTPAINVTTNVSDGLVFYGRSRDPLYPEVISVKISTTTPTANAFTTILAATVAPPSGATFTKYTFDLSAYIGQTIYIGFYSSTTDMFYFDIDDVTVGNLSSLATNETSIIKQFSIYPNPTSDFVNIHSKEKIMDIQIINLSGQVVKRFENSTTKLDIKELPIGTYFLQMNIDGKKTNHKIIKK